MTSESFSIEEEPLPGVFVLNTPTTGDNRGNFTKTYHSDIFNSLGIPFRPAEQFTTRSHSGVLRGMHFQSDESAHLKLVSCQIGKILDVVVSIDPCSAYFNKPFAIELGSHSSQALLIGKLYAHGFLALEESSWVHYLTSTVHDPAKDKGVHWASIAFDWPTITTPITSPRDARLPHILDLTSQ
jgi:hypothetical protein